DVRRLQRIFVMIKTLAPSNITGTFDVTTEQAVKDFQQGAGLTVDGIVGPITWQALPADPNTPVLARGASGSVVTALQQDLKKYSTPATDPGPVDGVEYFLRRSEEHTSELQSRGQLVCRLLLEEENSVE